MTMCNVNINGFVLFSNLLGEFDIASSGGIPIIGLLCVDNGWRASRASRFLRFSVYTDNELVSSISLLYVRKTTHMNRKHNGYNNTQSATSGRYECDAMRRRVHIWCFELCMRSTYV